MKISIDIETYSSVDLKRYGLYAYANSPDFELLILAYSIDGQPPVVIDVAQGEPIPHGFWERMRYYAATSHAYNAAFEWYCLNVWQEKSTLRDVKPLPPSAWRCTSVHAAYCGYPSGLGNVGKAMGLPVDKQKSTVGAQLIKYFCVPCTPTKRNGGRTRNMPHHDPQKWELFKQYCAQDVVAEMEIADRLAAFPLPDFVQVQWETDLAINSRGVAVDLDLVDGAIAIAADQTAVKKAESIALTQLANPNSRDQLLAWIGEQTGVLLGDVRKDTVSDMLAATMTPATVRRVLELRQELSKTSNKKYDAIRGAVCEDGRVRGTLQFYGANRTGRWAGRIIQPQNIPRTFIKQLDFARDCIKKRDVDALSWAFGDVADTLSQMIRTALVAAPGKMLVDADFSAIEARVLAWLAGEEWVLEVFRTHGKIYEATAANMFHIPLEKIKKGNPEYDYRQKGKVATLALGYQGGVKALEAMGALRNGLKEEELPEIVQLWRAANRRICGHWYACDEAAQLTLQTGRPHTVGRVTFALEGTAAGLRFLTLRLPNGRKLFYVDPKLGENQWGKPSITYRGVDQKTKRWGQLDTYGGKLAENITQAVARDLLAESVERLEANGYPLVFHVHDEVVCEVQEETADAALADVIRIMSEVPSWAEGLPLAADGWVGKYFKKD